MLYSTAHLNALIYIYQSRGYPGLNYLDDLAAAAAWSRAWAAYEALYNLLLELNIWESAHKRSPPDVVMSFLGILVNTLTLQLSLTPERLQSIKEETRQWLDRSTASKKDLQRLIGKLNFAATTVRSGRLFFSRILSFMTDLPKHGVRKISAEVKKDCRWWALFIEEYNGISMIHELSWRPVDSVISTDACLSGIGAFHEGEYLHAQIPPSLKMEKICPSMNLSASL